VRRRNRGAFDLGSAPTRRTRASAAGEVASEVVAMRLTPTQLAALERDAARHHTTPGVRAREIVTRTSGATR
jgi:hypothetical protein